MTVDVPPGPATEPASLPSRDGIGPPSPAADASASSSKVYNHLREPDDDELAQLGRRLRTRDEPAATLVRAMRLPRGVDGRVTMRQFEQALAGDMPSDAPAALRDFFARREHARLGRSRPLRPRRRCLPALRTERERRPAAALDRRATASAGPPTCWSQQADSPGTPSSDASARPRPGPSRSASRVAWLGAARAGDSPSPCP